eukprot:c13526_g1_i1 orf=545-2107(-)
MEEEPSLNVLYDIEDTASYILRRGYTRVALQFPDELLKVSVVVSLALRNELRKQSQSGNIVRLYVLADTTYGSCCADEIAAAHVNAECIVHYGHTCLSQMSKLPVWYVFGRATIDAGDCVHQMVDYGSRCRKRMLVLFDLEYTHAMPDIGRRLLESQLECGGDSLNVSLADVPIREMYPANHAVDSLGGAGRVGTKEQESEPNGNPSEAGEQSSTRFTFGGLTWTLPIDCKMEDTLLVWIGQEGPALTNIMLTFNASTVVLYDPERKLLVTDVAKQSKFLMRRYYLVERAKDANIVGIVIGTLGVAGYREMVHAIKSLVKESGKKSYTLAMGRPNPAKLANFPECDIFVLVACAQTALLDSKDFMVPVITPFEAIIAWKRGSQWTGAYSLDFRSLREYCDSETNNSGRERGSIQPQEEKEARFSFIKGSYVEAMVTNTADQENDPCKSLCLARDTEQALQLQARGSSELLGTKPEARSGVEYFVSRTFQGLEIDAEERRAEHYTMGRKGRAAVYNEEPAK